MMVAVEFSGYSLWSVYIILAIYFKKDLSIILFILDLVLYILLDIGFIMIKLKKDKKGIIKNLQL